MKTLFATTIAALLAGTVWAAAQTSDCASPAGSAAGTCSTTGLPAISAPLPPAQRSLDNTTTSSTTGGSVAPIVPNDPLGNNRTDSLGNSAPLGSTGSVTGATIGNPGISSDGSLGNTGISGDRM